MKSLKDFFFRSFLAAIVGCLFFVKLPQTVEAFKYESLPSDNLIQNPWFRNNCKPSLSGWQTTPDVPWKLSEKVQDPTDINCVGSGGQEWWGFAARFAKEGGEQFLPKKDAKLWQVVGPVNENDRTLQVHFLIVAHRVNQYKAEIFGSDSPNGPWVSVWTPLNIQNCLSTDCVNNAPGGGCNSGNRQCLWKEVTTHFLGSEHPISKTIPKGYKYYKVEFLMNYPDPVASPVTGDVGGKLARVYFSVKSAGGGTTTPSATPSQPTHTPIQSTSTPSATSIAGNTITPTTQVVAAQCGGKRALKNGEQIDKIQIGEEFTYELRLSPSNHTGAKITDPIPEGLSVIENSLPEYCSASGNVLGASTIRAGLSNTTIFLVFLTIVWLGGAVYLVGRYATTKDIEALKIGKKTISKRGLKQIIVIWLGVTGLMLVVVAGAIIKDRKATPEDTSAAEGTTVICNQVPNGEMRVRFNVKAVSGNGAVTNKATVLSGGVSSVCEYTITILGINTPTPTNPSSVTPSVGESPAITPTVTITATPPGTVTPKPTTTINPTSTTTPAPTNTSVPTVPAEPTNQPTTGAGIACGRADANNDGKFTLADFIEFAGKYQRECNDGHLDYGECGHKDVNRSGKIDISDFISFASRYHPRQSCRL